MADAADSKSVALKSVWVQVPSSAHRDREGEIRSLFFSIFRQLDITGAGLIMKGKKDGGFHPCAEGSDGFV